MLHWGTAEEELSSQMPAVDVWRIACVRKGGYKCEMVHVDVYIQPRVSLRDFVCCVYNAACRL